MTNGLFGGSDLKETVAASDVGGKSKIGGIFDSESDEEKPKFEEQKKPNGMYMPPPIVDDDDDDNPYTFKPDNKKP